MTLLKIMFAKEKIHWARMCFLFDEMEGIGGKLITYPIIVIIISFFHYCFATMHFLFECVMFLFNHNQFKLNIVSLQKSVEKTNKEHSERIKKVELL